MSMKAIRLLRSPTVAHSLRRSGLALALALGLVGGLPAPAESAQECSVETLGQAAYTRVKQKIEERFGTKEGFELDPYKKVDIAVESDCVIILHGRFRFKVKTQTQRKVFDTRMTPKDGAPNGLEILSYEITNG